MCMSDQTLPSGRARVGKGSGSRDYTKVCSRVSFNLRLTFVTPDSVLLANHIHFTTPACTPLVVSLASLSNNMSYGLLGNQIVIKYKVNHFDL